MPAITLPAYIKQTKAALRKGGTGWAGPSQARPRARNGKPQKQQNLEALHKAIGQILEDISITRGITENEDGTELVLPTAQPAGSGFLGALP